MGKNIGGTLGAPFEWKRQVNNVSFYTQDPGGEPLPNDDLDIQLLWLVALEERGIEIDAHTLAEYWVLYVTPHWSEYGTAKTNMRSGFMPPLSGTLNNDYKDSCGAFIRSEIWACIAPGVPNIAARFAFQDAILDHGDGEGVYAEVFCATLESAAFVENDIFKLIEIGLSYIPSECGVAGAVQEAASAFKSGKSWREARDLILEKHRGGTFFNMPDHISQEDREKGYDEGKRGFDAPSNIGMLLIGLLYGQGDFAKTVCTAVNCGEDTDCTGATAGSIFGLLHGIEGIPSEWTVPIGRKIKTACLNLGELGYFGDQLPADIDDLTWRVERVARQVILRNGLDISLANAPTDLSSLRVDSLLSDETTKMILSHVHGPLYRFDFFDFGLDYEDGPFLRDGIPCTIRVKAYNTYKVQANLNIRWYAPEEWRIFPAREGRTFSLPAHLGDAVELTFQIETDHVPSNVNRAVLEFTVDGRPTVMLVPILLANGNLRAIGIQPT